MELDFDLGQREAHGRRDFFVRELVVTAQQQDGATIRVEQIDRSVERGRCFCAGVQGFGCGARVGRIGGVDRRLRVALA